MSALEDARNALKLYDQTEIAEEPIAYRLAHDLRALIAEHEALTASLNPMKTIAQRAAYDAAVSNRAREIADTRELVQAATAPPTDDERETLAPIRELVAALASRLHHVETHWTLDERSAPMPTADVLREFDRLAAGFRRQGPITDERITIRHEGGNTLTGTVDQVLSTHLAKGWVLEAAERVR